MPQYYFSNKINCKMTASENPPRENEKKYATISDFAGYNITLYPGGIKSKHYKPLNLI